MFIKFAISLFLISLHSLAHGKGIHSRCPEDKISSAREGRGRNQWAQKCGYLSIEDVEYMNGRGFYVVFKSGKQPRDVNQACIGGLSIQGFCAVGCFAPQQDLLFGQRSIAIAEAFGKGEEMITALSQSSTSSRDLQFSEAQIESFTRGESNNPLLEIVTLRGHTVNVTREHPIVREDGTLIPARQLILHENIATIDGPDEIVRLTWIPFSGQVWNIQPRNEDVESNINIAGGILTGSLRFQNQWAERGFRIWKRVGGAL